MSKVATGQDVYNDKQLVKQSLKRSRIQCKHCKRVINYHNKLKEQMKHPTEYISLTAMWMNNNSTMYNNRMNRHWYTVHTDTCMCCYKNKPQPPNFTSELWQENIHISTTLYKVMGYEMVPYILSVLLARGKQQTGETKLGTGGGYETTDTMNCDTLKGQICLRYL